MTPSHRARAQGHKKLEGRPRGRTGVSSRPAPAGGATPPTRAFETPAALYVRIAKLHQEIAKTHIALARAMEQEHDQATVGATGPEPWLTLAQAATHLGVPESRLYKLRARAEGGRERNPLPFERDGQRLHFRRSELDAWVQRGGADV